MLPSNAQSLFRRGGVLHGPRLIAAILTVFILVFYFSPSNRESYPSDLSRPLNSASDSGWGSKDIVQEYTDEYNREQESDSLSDKFFEYLGHHKDPVKPTTTTSSSLVVASPTSGASILDIPADPICDALAKAAQDILVIVNAAAPELYNQLPGRLLTNLRCAPLSIFSTVSSTLGAHIVHDAIASVSTDTIAKHHTAFDLYKKQRDAQTVFQNLADLTSGIKELEKWTIIPALIESYKKHPKKKFFVLVTPSTYLSLPNLLAWLPSLSPNVPIYAGEVMNDGISAPMSSGILLSRAAVAALYKKYGESRLTWEDSANSRESADAVLGEALKESGVLLSKSFPNFQSDNILNLGWGSAIWCKAPVAWGGMSPSLMDLVWEFERNWTTKHVTALLPEPAPTTTSTSTTKGWFDKWSPETSTTSEVGAATGIPTSLASPVPTGPAFPPYHYSTLLTTILSPILYASPNRSSWDNGADSFIITDTTRASSYAHSSALTCRAACDIRAKCLQYVWESNKCRLGTQVRIGGSAEGAMSGWVTTRVRKFVAQQKCPKDEEAGPFVPVLDAKDQPAGIFDPLQEDALPSGLSEVDFDEPESGEQGKDPLPPAEQEQDKTGEPKPSEVDHAPAEATEKVEIIKDPTVEAESLLDPPPMEEKDEGL